MLRTPSPVLLSLLATPILLSSCVPASADPVKGGPRAAPLEARPPAQRSPYRVELLGEDGQAFPTFQHRGRYYVEGETGERYSVRVTNPTGRRVEAVISIDGLDAVDGRTADFVHKRGYIVPPYGELVVDGFRVSLDDVATFRFSSVSNSYAGRKGEARNVGVIGVAIFAGREEEQPVLMPEPTMRGRYDNYDDGDEGGWYEERERRSVPSAGAPAKKGYDRAPAGSANQRSVPARPSAPGERGKAAADRAAAEAAPSTPCCTEPQPERPGLGTEFGERRSSRVSYVSFERENASRPTAVAELRYNDHDGLQALGVLFGAPIDGAELELRETATPFPASPYASPPSSWKR